MAPDGTLYDYFGGADDLRAGRVRFVGEAARRIAEDYLRILRFFRFWARYGTGDPDPDAGAAIAAGVSGLSILSPERVWSELKRILAAPDPMRAVALMAELGVLAAVLPGGAHRPAVAAGGVGARGPGRPRRPPASVERRARPTRGVAGHGRAPARLGRRCVAQGARRHPGRHPDRPQLAARRRRSGLGIAAGPPRRHAAARLSALRPRRGGARHPAGTCGGRGAAGRPRVVARRWLSGGRPGMHGRAGPPTGSAPGALIDRRPWMPAQPPPCRATNVPSSCSGGFGASTCDTTAGGSR